MAHAARGHPDRRHRRGRPPRAAFSTPSSPEMLRAASRYSRSTGASPTGRLERTTSWRTGRSEAGRAPPANRSSPRRFSSSWIRPSATSASVRPTTCGCQSRSAESRARGLRGRWVQPQDAGQPAGQQLAGNCVPRPAWAKAVTPPSAVGSSAFSAGSFCQLWRRSDSSIRGSDRSI